MQSRRARRAQRFFLIGFLLVLGAMSTGCDRRSTPAAGVARAAASADPPMHLGKYRFLSLGDSYTIGEGVANADRWPMQLADRLRQRGLAVSDPQIIARTGWTTGDLLEAMDQRRPQPPFQLVTLLIGVNNQFQGRSEDEYRQQLAELLGRCVALAQGEPRRVVMLSIPDWSVTPFGGSYDTVRMKREIAQFNQINLAEASRAGARFVDITAESLEAASQPDLLADDGLHPSAKQYAQWAALTLDTAAAALTSPTATTKDVPATRRPLQ